MAFQYIKGPCRKDRDRLYSRICSDRTGSNDFKPKDCRFRQGIRKKLVMKRVMKHCNRFPGEIIDSPSLEGLKIYLDGPLRTSWRTVCHGKDPVLEQGKSMRKEQQRN